MSMNVGDNKGGAIADINVTPMADVIIVLLIIFMVITPLLQKGVDVKLPVAGNTEERKDDPEFTTVGINFEGDVFINGAVVEKSLLKPQVEERLQDVPEGERLVYLKGDERLDYGQIMEIMDLCREAGVEEIALIAEPEVQG
jgi:biopolymer transport protein ExbD